MVPSGVSARLSCLLAQAEEEIRLIFARVAALAQNGASPEMLNDRVVSGGDVVRSQGGGLAPQIAKFEQFVAHHAGIRRATGLVLARK